MKASKKSIHARLYKFTYWSHDLPENLCPYFWKLVWATLVFIPNFILQLPTLLIELFNKRKKYYDCDDRRMGGFTIYVLTLLFLGYICITYQWIKAAVGAYSYDAFLANLGWIINLLIGVIGILLLITYFKNSIREKKREKRLLELEKRAAAEGKTYDDLYWEEERAKKENRPNIIIEFIKAKYNKYCPKIDWN